MNTTVVVSLLVTSRSISIGVAFFCRGDGGDDDVIGLIRGKFSD